MAANQENEIDQALILRMGQGDEEALRDFILRYQDRVYGTVAKMIGNTGPDVRIWPSKFFCGYGKPHLGIGPRRKFQPG
jgi:hypothetical protein